MLSLDIIIASTLALWFDESDYHVVIGPEAITRAKEEE